ncbi:DUF4255 domain-containing protein [Belliella aquatica]|uniref:Pvc16 N-terminal domain-containing protein n=1 Tax=Belliella aquatica TaxID=1323734 RepID=A0ABQ1MAZ6_9BACT|nr:DUF4255 domain-containing protein [Belliella aquatica]MCH7406307.1 DUF4255 domain-containing protein [Belliella aquatica]GGC37761.1 hypothetical protein GCM10010993_15790 [Belliella aquatica]
MIHKVVPAVIASLNEYIRNELNLQDDMVILTNPVDMKGSLNTQIDNKLCVFLQHLEEEKLIKNGAYQANAGMNPPMHFNIYLMFIANFPDPNYLESLRFVSIVLEFFQGSRVFDRSNLPLLSNNVEKIAFEYVNLDSKELSNIWGMIGLKYMPSLIYKMKLLSFTNNLIREEVPSIIGQSKKNIINKKSLEDAARAAISLKDITSQNDTN